MNKTSPWQMMKNLLEKLQDSKTQILNQIIIKLTERKVSDDKLWELVSEQFPPRCYCNAVIGTIANQCFFGAACRFLLPLGLVLNDLGLTKQCCRARFLQFPLERFEIFYRYEEVIPRVVYHRVLNHMWDGFVDFQIIEYADFKQLLPLPLLLLSVFKTLSSKMCAYAGHFQWDEKLGFGIGKRDPLDVVNYDLACTPDLYAAPYHRKFGLSPEQVQHAIETRETSPAWWPKICLTLSVEDQCYFVLWDTVEQIVNLVGDKSQMAKIECLLTSSPRLAGVTQKLFGKMGKIYKFSIKGNRKEQQAQVFFFLYTHAAVSDLAMQNLVTGLSEGHVLKSSKIFEFNHLVIEHMKNSCGNSKTTEKTAFRLLLDQPVLTNQQMILHDLLVEFHRTSGQ